MQILITLSIIALTIKFVGYIIIARKLQKMEEN